MGRGSHPAPWGSAYRGQRGVLGERRSSGAIGTAGEGTHRWGGVPVESPEPRSLAPVGRAITQGPLGRRAPSERAWAAAERGTDVGICGPWWTVRPAEDGWPSGAQGELLVPPSTFPARSGLTSEVGRDLGLGRRRTLRARRLGDRIQPEGARCRSRRLQQHVARTGAVPESGEGIGRRDPLAMELRVSLRPTSHRRLRPPFRARSAGREIAVAHAALCGPARPWPSSIPS